MKNTAQREPSFSQQVRARTRSVRNVSIRKPVPVFTHLDVVAEDTNRNPSKQALEQYLRRVFGHKLRVAVREQGKRYYVRVLGLMLGRKDIVHSGAGWRVRLQWAPGTTGSQESISDGYARKTGLAKVELTSGMTVHAVYNSRGYSSFFGKPFKSQSRT